MQHSALQKPRRRVEAARGLSTRRLSRKAFLTGLLLFLALAFAHSSPDRAFAEMRGMRVYCPSGQTRAPGGTACVSVTPANPNVNIANAGTVAIYVGFTSGRRWGKITWANTTGCTPVGMGLKIAANTTCAAAAIYDNTSTRFCAVASPPAPAAIPNCALAQTNHQTLVETTFQTTGTCAPIPGPCAWYDISVIPSNCADALWKQNRCLNTGGAS